MSKFNCQSFIYTHIPKCGGTSFREYIYNTGLKNNISVDKMHIPGCGGLSVEKNIAQLSQEELADFRASGKLILAAHCMFDVHKDYDLNMHDPFYYILFREPVGRFISHYNFFCRQLGFRNLKDVHLNDVEEETLKYLLIWTSNIQIEHVINGLNFTRRNQTSLKKLKRLVKKSMRTLSSGRLFSAKSVGIRAEVSWLEEAEKLLTNEYGAFGIIEQMDLSLEYLKMCSPPWLKFSTDSFPVRNVGNKITKDLPVEGQIIDAIKSYNIYDTLLYDMAGKLLSKKIQTLKFGGNEY